MPHDVYEFIRLVDELRQRQRLYFKTRSPQVLEESKRAERRVDDWIRDYKNDQGSLFKQ